MQNQKKRSYILTLTLDFDHMIIIAILLFSTINIYMYTGFFQWRTNWFLVYGRYARYILLALSMIYIAYVYIRGEKKKISIFTVAVYIYLIFMLAVTIVYHRSAFATVIHEGLTWPLTMVAYYYYASRNKFTWVYRGCLVMAYLGMLIPMLGILGGNHAERANIGVVNYFISFLPLILFLCKRKTKLILVILAVIFAVMSQKRGASLSLMIGFMLMSLYYFYENRDTHEKIRYALLVLMLILILSWMASTLDVTRTLIERFLNAAEDKGSGRDLIYYQLLEGFRRSPIILKIVGHGYHAFPRDYQPYGVYMYAHNSFLETLYDLGIVGLTGLILFIVAVAVKIWQMIKVRESIGYPAMLALSITIVLSMVAYFFDECASVLMIASFYGVVLGMGQQTAAESQPKKREKEKTKCKYIW